MKNVKQQYSLYVQIIKKEKINKCSHDDFHTIESVDYGSFLVVQTSYSNRDKLKTF